MFKRSLPFLLGAVLQTGCDEAPPPPPDTSAERCDALPASVHERLDAFVTERMQQEHVPGLSLAILQDGKTVCLKAYGLANLETKERMTARTRMSIGSTTKSMTALALMQQVEAGKVDLDAPVTRYLPWFRTADGLQGQILVKHLLTHTSGLPGSYVWDGAHDEGALERRVRELAHVTLRFTPGQGDEYSNDGVTVLGLIVQTVSGKPFTRYLADAVFTPLGMTHTFVNPAPPEGPDMSQPYVRTRGELQRRMPPTSLAHAPAGSATFTSAEDVALYLSGLLAGGVGPGGRVLSARNVERMWQPLMLPDRGMGWELSPPSGRRTVFHGGNTPISSSMFMMYPAERAAVAVISNRNTPATTDVALGVSALLFGEALPPVTPSPFVERPPSTFVPDVRVWQDYVGTFDTRKGRIDITVEDQRLWATFHLGQPSVRVELEAYGDNDFVTRDEYAVLEAVAIRFQHEPDGGLSLLFMGQPIGKRLEDALYR
ncbi:MAG: serine hydrolase [Cystobacter sp.]